MSKVIESGCVSGDCFNGTGKRVYENGYYEGEFKDGKKHGQGVYTYPSGDKYVGEWKNGEMHGEGTYTHANGYKEKMIFKDGVDVSD